MADLYNPQNDRCLCNTHVESGARAIAIVFLVLDALSVFYFILQLATVGVTGVTVIQLLWTVLAICLLALVLKAQKKRDPSLYVPYLIIMGVQAAFSIAVPLILIFCMLFFRKAFIEFIREESHIDLNDDMLPALMVSTTVGALIGLVIHVYLFSVMWRAYKFMKSEAIMPTNA